MSVVKFEINIIFLLLACVMGTSCNDAERIKKKIKRMQLQETHLHLSEMDLYTMEDNEKEVLYSFERCPMKLVVYVDSTSCSSCLMKNMYHWYDVIDEVERRYHGKLKTVFIFNPIKKQLRIFEYAYRNSAFGYPIFVDTTNVFRRMNTHIANSKEYHTFLLNEENRVVLVGCPLTNPEVKEMLFDWVDQSLEAKR